MRSKKKNTPIYIGAFLLFVAALGYLCFFGFTENSVYFLNVAEAQASSPDKLRQARLFGTVSPASLARELNSVEFNLADKDNETLTIPVVYAGIIPDAFKAGAEVIVEGTLGQDGRFNAKTLMTKCPSKYKKENRGARL